MNSKPYYFLGFVLLSMQMFIVLLLWTACMNKKPIKSVQYKYIYISRENGDDDFIQQQPVPLSFPFTNVSLAASRRHRRRFNHSLQNIMQDERNSQLQQKHDMVKHQEEHAAKKEEEHAAKKEEEHAAKKEEEHAAKKEEEHATKKEEEHAAKKEEEHATKKEEEHATKKEEEHATKKEEEHAGKKEEEHATKKEEEHAAKKEEEHAAKKEEEHAAKKEEEHATKKEEEHAAMKEEEHATKKEEEHAAKKEEEHAAKKEEEHAAKKEEHAGKKEGGAIFANWTNATAHVEPEFPPLEPDTPVVITDAPHAHGENSILRPETVSSEFKFALEVFEYPAEHLLFHVKKPVSTYVRELLPHQVEQVGREYVRWDRERFKKQGGRCWRGSRKTEGRDATKIHKIWIWGERNSCTTLITSLLQKNFHMNCSTTAPASCVIGGLPWKHGFMRTADLRDQSRTLNILVTRSPYEWIESMHRHPFYAEIHKNLSMKTFLAREWITFDEAESFDGLSASYEQGDIKPRRNLICQHDIRLRRNETCLSGGKSFACVELPGLKADTPWITNSSHSPHPNCFPGPKSNATCGDKFLCTNLEHRWLKHGDLSAWRRNLSNFILDSTLHPLRIFVPDRPKPSMNLTELVCIAFRQYPVSSGDELPPGVSCHDGETSWGKCSGGRFVCHVNSSRWWEPAPRVWVVVRNRLLSASRLIREYFFAHLFTPPLASREKLEDRDADTGGRFPNILAMRAAKLRDWFLVADKHLDFHSHVACRDFFIDPEAVLNELRDEFQLQPKHAEWQLSQCMTVFGKFSCPQRHRGYSWTSNLTSAKRRYYTHGHFARKFSREILRFMSAWLDLELEGSLGYRVHQDVESLSVPYSPLTRCREHRPAANNMPCYGNCSRYCHTR